jgi:hypothetical protein
MYVSVHKRIERLLTFVKNPCFCVDSPKKSPPTSQSGGLMGLKGRAVYIVSMKLRSLSERLGCLSLRSALASI